MIDSFTTEQLGDGLVLHVSPEHRFGTDAFLLAHFAAARHRDLVADLGTGCGIIPMILYKKYRPSHIWGIDIQPQAIQQFSQSVMDSKLDKILQPLCADLRSLKGLLPFDSFDLVTCNPPYETAGSGFLSANPAHQIARHELCCTIEDVCQTASQLLKTGGRFCLCHRPGRLTDVLTAMRRRRLEPKRLRFVAKDEHSAPWLFLAEGKKDAKPSLEVMPTLFISGQKGAPSAELREIYGLDSGKDVTT